MRYCSIVMRAISEMEEEGEVVVVTGLSSDLLGYRYFDAGFEFRPAQDGRGSLDSS